MVTVMLDLFERYSDQYGKKLESFPGKNITDCYIDIISDSEILDSSGTLKYDHLDNIHRKLEDSKD